jgi:hypothetical protein
MHTAVQYRLHLMLRYMVIQLKLTRGPKLFIHMNGQLPRGCVAAAATAAAAGTWHTQAAQQQGIAALLGGSPTAACRRP